MLLALQEIISFRLSVHLFVLVCSTKMQDKIMSDYALSLRFKLTILSHSWVGIAICNTKLLSLHFYHRFHLNSI